MRQFAIIAGMSAFLLLALYACTAPALVLQRETRDLRVRIDAANGRPLSAHEHEHLALCLSAVQLAERLAHADAVDEFVREAPYPSVSASTETALKDAKKDCADVDKWGAGSFSANLSTHDGGPPSDAAGPVRDLTNGGRRD